MGKKKQKKISIPTNVYMPEETVKLDDIQKINAWLNENGIPHRIDSIYHALLPSFPVQVVYKGVAYRFKTEEDACAFKLGWT